MVFLPVIPLVNEEGGGVLGHLEVIVASQLARAGVLDFDVALINIAHIVIGQVVDSADLLDSQGLALGEAHQRTAFVAAGRRAVAVGVLLTGFSAGAQTHVQNNQEV